MQSYLCELLLQRVDFIQQRFLLLLGLPEAFLKGLIFPFQILKYTTMLKNICIRPNYEMLQTPFGYHLAKLKNFALKQGNKIEGIRG